MLLGADLTIYTLEHILAGDLTPIPQSHLLKGEEPTPAPKIFKETCKIDWNADAKAVHNLVRGLSPYPAAWTEMADNDSMTKFKIFETRIVNTPTSNPGKVEVKDGHLFVDCATGKVEILQLQPDGKKRMSTADFLRGAHLKNPKML